MSAFHRLSYAISIFAAVFCVGFFNSPSKPLAEEFTAPAFETFGFKIAYATPFETMPEEPIDQLAQPFGLSASALVPGDLQDKWNTVTMALPHEREILARCRVDANSCPPAAKKFLAIIEKALTRTGMARIGELNRAINLAVRWVDDMTQYGVPDLWATPLMTFASDAGNCKDYAIAKYVALQEMGVATEDLRLVVVRDRPTKELHAVTALRYEGRWLILDNRTFIMVQDVEVATYNPLFIIDSEGVKRMIPMTPKPQNPIAGLGSAVMGLQFSSAWQIAPLVM
jgi:predicted transglutaminase-like cysteine proteinase